MERRNKKGVDDCEEDEDDFEASMIDFMDKVGSRDASPSAVAERTNTHQQQHKASKRPSTGTIIQNNANSQPQMKISKQTSNNHNGHSDSFYIHGELINVRKQNEQLKKTHADLHQQYLNLQLTQKQQLEQEKQQWKEKVHQLETALKFEQHDRIMRASMKKRESKNNNSYTGEYPRNSSRVAIPTALDPSISTSVTTIPSMKHRSPSILEHDHSTSPSSMLLSSSLPRSPAPFAAYSTSFKHFKQRGAYHLSLDSIVSFFEANKEGSSSPRYIEIVNRLATLVKANPSAVAAIMHRRTTPYDQDNPLGISSTLFPHARKPLRLGHQHTKFPLAGAPALQIILQALFSAIVNAPAQTTPPVFVIPTLNCLNELFLRAHRTAVTSHVSCLFDSELPSCLSKLSSFDPEIRTLCLQLYTNVPRLNNVLPRDIQYLAIEHDDYLIRICLAEIYRPHDVFLAFQLFEDIHSLLEKAKGAEQAKSTQLWSLVMRAVRSEALSSWQQFSPQPHDVVQVCFSFSVAEELILAFKNVRGVVRFDDEAGCAEGIQAVYDTAVNHAKLLLVVATDDDTSVPP
eukprot:m.49899 g.49899  ORF g.49899 m.49899 type:complete len:572 (-) comp7477_c0_seq2:219-1934(-)